MIKYLGSKRTLLPVILEGVRAIEARIGPVTSVLDLFSGTSRVGHMLKSEGYRVVANDHNAYAAALARCYVEVDRDDVEADARRLIDELNALPGRPGYFTETFCVRSRFVGPHNGERIDAIREWIADGGLPAGLEAVLLVALMEAADRVDSTTGLQMAYLKQWAPRSTNDLRLRMPDVLPRAMHGRGAAHQLDAFEAAGQISADVAYIDPPYNQHSYLGNYHVWESLIRWDKPATYGRACKRVDVPQRRSVFNSRPQFEGALQRLLESVRARAMIVSFSNEGFLPRERVESMLRAVRGGAHVETLERNNPRYVGARIGIHNPQGERVGTIGELRNTEFVFLVIPQCDPARS